jgi:hypothetical protein
VYAALWHILPGPWWLRVLILIAAAAAMIAALVLWVFPIVDHLLEPQEVTVQQ